MMAAETWWERCETESNMMMRLQRKRARREMIGGVIGSMWHVLVLIVLALASQPAYATINCTGNAETITIYMPNQITIPRDAPVGTLMSQWMSSPANTSYFLCTKTVQEASGSGFEPISLNKSGLTIAGPDGVKVTVWNTNIKGVGVAIEVRPFSNGCGWLSWVDLGAPATYWYPKPWIGTPCSGGGDIRNGGQVKAAYVKTGPISGSSSIPNIIMVGTAVRVASMTSPSLYTYPYIVDESIAKTFFIYPTGLFVASCTTSNVTVELGQHHVSEFKGQGFVLKPVAFSIPLDACPPGLAKIQYQFTPVGAVIFPAIGVIALSGASSTFGVAIQLRDGDGKPLKFNTPYTLGGYNPASGGSYRIPLTAAYYQTLPVVTPGNADASLLFTINYQ